LTEATARMFKFGSATPVHPDATLIVAPGGAFLAGRVADLADQSDAATHVGLAINPPSVVGGTGDGTGARALMPTEAATCSAENPRKYKPLVRVAVNLVDLDPRAVLACPSWNIQRFAEPREDERIAVFARIKAPLRLAPPSKRAERTGVLLRVPSASSTFPFIALRK